MEARRRRQVQTREQVHLYLLSIVQASIFEESKNDEHWIKAMEEELSQIENNETWELVPRPKDRNVIDTKWVFKNKLNEDGQVTRNKAKRVCKGYAKLKECILRKPFLLLLKWKQSKLSCPMHTPKESKYIKWM